VDHTQQKVQPNGQRTRKKWEHKQPNIQLRQLGKKYAQQQHRNKDPRHPKDQPRPPKIK